MASIKAKEGSTDELTAKIVIVGRKGVGKTSMRTLIFDHHNIRPGDTWKLPSAKGIERNVVRLLSRVNINVWEVQPTAINEDKTEEQSEVLYGNVSILVFVFDVSGGGGAEEFAKDLHTLETAVAALRSHSPNAKLFILLHKYDLLAGGSDLWVKGGEADIKKAALPTLSHLYCTSIWDESLYRAWSAIISATVPNLPQVNSEMTRLLERLRADEVILIEVETLLVLAHQGRRHFHDSHRFEKISNILKRFTLTSKKFECLPKSIYLHLREGSLLIWSVLSMDIGLLVILPPSRDSQTTTPPSTMEEQVSKDKDRCGDASSEISSFKSVLNAIFDASPVIDPHLL